MRPAQLTLRSAFTMLEVMLVVTILAILAAVVVPRFGGLSDDARSSAAVSAVAGVRSSIAGYRTRQVIAGEDPFPTLADLTTPGTVLQGEMPANPYSGLRAVRAVSAGEADDRTVSQEAQYGWCYFVDNASTPPRAVLYLNSSDQTRVPNDDGTFKLASEL